MFYTSPGSLVDHTGGLGDLTGNSIQLIWPPKVLLQKKKQNFVFDEYLYLKLKWNVVIVWQNKLLKGHPEIFIIDLVWFLAIMVHNLGLSQAHRYTIHLYHRLDFKPSQLHKERIGKQAVQIFEIYGFWSFQNGQYKKILWTQFFFMAP